MPDSNGGGFSVMAPMLATHFDTQCGSFSNLILLCVLISITGVDTLLFVIYTYWALNGILFDFSIISLNVFIRGVAKRGTVCRLLEDKISPFCLGSAIPKKAFTGARSFPLVDMKLGSFSIKLFYFHTVGYFYRERENTHLRVCY